MNAQLRAENPAIEIDPICEDCGEKMSLHDYDEDGDVLDCTGDQYVEATLERARKAYTEELQAERKGG